MERTGKASRQYTSRKKIFMRRPPQEKKPIMFYKNAAGKNNYLNFESEEASEKFKTQVTHTSTCHGL
jgi:hypothetical protein